MTYRGVLAGKISILFNSQEDSLVNLAESELNVIESNLENNQLKENNIKTGGSYIEYKYQKNNKTTLGYLFKRNNENAIKFEFKISGYKDYVKPRINTLVESFQWFTEKQKKESNTYRLRIHELKKDDTLETVSTEYFGNNKKRVVIAAFNNIKTENQLKERVKIKIPK